MSVEPVEDSVGLLIRIWTEDDDPGVVRARLLTCHGTDEPRSWRTAAGEHDVLAALEDWVRDRLRQQAGSVRPPAEPA